MEAKVWEYVYFGAFAKLGPKGGGNIRFTGGAVVNAPPRPAIKATGTLQFEAECLRSALAPSGEFILHAREDLFTRAGDGTPLASRLIHGCGGRRVPWGVLQEITEVDESDVQIWTATFGPYAGKTAGVALTNPRMSASLLAVFLVGNPPPERGSIFQYRRDNGQMSRMICLKVTRRWQNEGFLALQIEGTAWDSPLTRFG